MFYFMCMRFCLDIYLYTMCAECLGRSEERALDSMDLEFQTVVSCHMGVGNGIWVLSKDC